MSLPLIDSPLGRLHDDVNIIGYISKLPLWGPVTYVTQKAFKVDSVTLPLNCPRVKWSISSDYGGEKVTKYPLQ